MRGSGNQVWAGVGLIVEGSILRCQAYPQEEGDLVDDDRRAGLV